MPKYPDITVQLSGEEGNVFAIIGRVTKALRQGGVSNNEIDEFQSQAMQSDSYDAVLQLVMGLVNVT